MSAGLPIDDPELYSTLVEKSNDGITIIQDGEFKFVNDRFAELHDTTPEDLIGESFLTHIDPEYRDLVRERYEQRVDGEDPPAKYEVEILDGKRTLEVNATPIEYEGQPADMGIVRDITERKERERELEQYETIVETVTDGICVLNRDSEFLMVNDAFVELTGVSREDLLGTHASMVRPAELNEAFDEMQRSLDAGSDIESIEMEIHPESGDPKVIDARYAKYSYEGETGRVGVWRDITERKNAREEVQEERDRREALFRNPSDPIVEIEFEEDTPVIQAVNGAFTDVFGYESEDVVGQAVPDVLVPDEDASQHRHEEIKQRVLDGETIDTDVVRQTTDGPRDFLLRVFPFEGAEGHRGSYAIYTDITERKERERELEAARKRYRTLLQTAPDPIFVADANTGEIIETNRAAEEFRGQPREEIIGLNQTDLHPDDDPEAYRTLFEDHVSEGGTRRRLSDGSPIYAVTANGEHIPVAISATSVELADGPVIYGIFRDISDQLAYERSLAGLNTAARELFEAESESEISHNVVETITKTLDLAGAAVYLFDETDSVLRPVAYAPAEEIETLFDEPPVFEPGDSRAWEAFTKQTSSVYDDVRKGESVSKPETPIRSEGIIPLGEWGLIIVGDTRPAAFDEQDVELVETLGETAQAALDRLEREHQLQQREQQLAQRTTQLEQVETINRQIRTVTQAIVDADTKQDIEQTACEHLVETDLIEFAWISDVDPVTDNLERRAQAGVDRGYLDGISTSLSEDTASEPAVQAARTHEQVLIPNIASDMPGESWRRDAVERGFQSVMSLPLMYQDVLQGVLTVYASTESAFSGIIHSVLAELGDLIAHALMTITRKQALLANRMTELEFEIQDPACFFLRFAQQTACTLELDGIVPQRDDTTLVFLQVQDADPQHVLEQARQAEEIESARLIGSNGEALIQLRFTAPFIASRLADQGIEVCRISAQDGTCRVTTVIPPTLDVAQTVEFVTSQYAETEVLAKRDATQIPTSLQNRSQDFLDQLTDRRREVLEVAYRSGYFETPRQTSSEAVADEVDISVSGFHRHIRRAEQTLFDIVFEHGTNHHSQSTTS